MGSTRIHQEQQAATACPVEDRFSSYIKCNNSRQKGPDQGFPPQQQQQQHPSTSEVFDAPWPTQQQQQQRKAVKALDHRHQQDQCSTQTLNQGHWKASQHTQHERPAGLNYMLQTQERQQQQQQPRAKAEHPRSILSLVQQLQDVSNNCNCDKCYGSALENAARDLGNIALQGPQQQSAIIAAAAIPLLLQHLGSSGSSLAMQGYCALALGKIALRNRDGQDLIGQLGGIQQLVQLLQSGKSNKFNTTTNSKLTITCDKDSKNPSSKDNQSDLSSSTTHLTDPDDSCHLPLRGCAALAIASLIWHNAHNSAAVAAAGGVEGLVQLIRDSSSSSESAEAQCHEVQALGKLQTKEAAAVAAGGVEGSMQLIRDSSSSSSSSIDNTEVQCHAVQALGSLHRNQAAAVAAAGGVQCLVLLLGSTAGSSSGSSYRLLDHVLKALLSLVHSGEASVHSDVLAPDAVSTLVALASNSSSTEHQQQPQPSAVAAAILAQLVQHSAENAAAVAVSGGISHFTMLLQHTYHSMLSPHAVINIRQNIASALAYLARYPEYRYSYGDILYPGLAAAAVETGLIKQLLLLLGGPGEGVQAAAAAALGGIISASGSSVLDQLIQIMLESGGVAALVRLLRSSSSSCCRPSNSSSSASARSNSNSPDRPVQSVPADVASVCSTSSSTSSSSSPARPSSSDGASLSGSSDGASLSGSSSSSIFAQEWAAYTLTVLAQYSHQMQAAVYAAGALEPLIAMLQNAPLQHTAAKCIAALCLDNAYIQSAVVFEGALPLLLALLGPQCTAETQAAAAAAVGNLVASNAGLRAAAAGAAEHVINLLTDLGSDLNIRTWAAYALAHLCKDNADVQSAVLHSGSDVLHALVGMIQAPTSDSCAGQHNALQCTGTSTVHCADAAAMHNAQLHAVCALANLAANAAMQAAIVQAGGLEALIRVLQPTSSDDACSPAGSSSSSSSSSKVQEVAALALWEMARHNPVISQHIAAAGAITPLVNILSTAAAGVTAVATDVASEASSSSSEAPRVAASSSPGSSSNSSPKPCLADSVQKWAAHAARYISQRGDHPEDVLDTHGSQHLELLDHTSAAAAAAAVSTHADISKQAAAAAAGAGTDQQRDAWQNHDSKFRSHPIHDLLAEPLLHDAARPMSHICSMSESSASTASSPRHSVCHLYIDSWCHPSRHESGFAAVCGSQGCRVTTAAAAASSSRRTSRANGKAVSSPVSLNEVVQVQTKGRNWQVAPLTAIVRPAFAPSNELCRTLATSGVTCGLQLVPDGHVAV